jgi:hypothetical protein
MDLALPPGEHGALPEAPGAGAEGEDFQPAGAEVYGPGGAEDAEEQPSTWEGYEVVHTETPRRVSAPAAPRPEHASSVPTRVLTLSEGGARTSPPFARRPPRQAPAAGP